MKIDDYRKMSCKQRKSLGFPEARGMDVESGGSLRGLGSLSLLVFLPAAGQFAFVDSIGKRREECHRGRKGAHRFQLHCLDFHGINRTVWKANLQALFMVINIV